MILFYFITLCLAACFFVFSFTHHLLSNLPLAFTLWISASLLYFTLLILLKKISDDRAAIRLIIISALVIRAVAFFAPAEMSKDYHRYLWDGKVGAAGINPYRYAPQDPALMKLRTPSFYGRTGFKKLPGSYCPAAEMSFRIMYQLFGPDAQGWHAIYILVDILNVFLVLALLSTLGISRKWAAVYALNPLVIVDLCANMHYDSMVIALLLGAVLCAARKRVLPGIVLLALATLMKYFAILFLPVFLVRAAAGRHGRDWLLRTAAATALFFAVIVAFYLPYIDVGAGVFKGILMYSNGATATAWTPHFFVSLIFGRITTNYIAAAALVAISLLGFKKTGPGEWLDMLFIIAAAISLLSPIQRPWYFIWAIPFCCIRIRWPWLFLSVMSLLTYLINVEFDRLYLIKFIIYMSFYASVLLELYFRARTAGSGQQPA